MRLARLGLMSLAFSATSVLAVAAETADLASWLDTLRQVAREGEGNRAASKAWAALTAQARAEQLPVILAALDGASPLAANWIRAAVDAIAERDLGQSGRLPLAELERFLHDQRHDRRARRLAFEWIVRQDATAADRLIPTMLDDPSLELRRDAVARVLEAAEESLTANNKEMANSTFLRALDSARDLDQVKLSTEALKKLGHPVDLAHHFGFILDWKVVGPFDNHQGKGFDTVYAPEQSVDLDRSYATPEGTVRWNAVQTDDEYGMVDLNKSVGKHMGALVYAAAEFRSDRERPAELRLGSENANKIWLNGRLLSTAEVYHANGTMDQYVGHGRLVAGRNVLLLKICQNEQTETWAQDWKFQLRVCDPTGKAILAIDRPPPRVADQQAAK